MKRKVSFGSHSSRSKKLATEELVISIRALTLDTVESGDTNVR
jgi:hypothetical protein